MKLRKQENIANKSPLEIDNEELDKEIDFNQETILAKVFRESEKKGFDLMFRYYYAPLCSNAIRILYDGEAAKDLVMDVFVDFWENRRHEDIKTTYRSYLYRAVRNRALNHLHRKISKDYLTSSLNDEVLNKGMQITPEDIISFHELSRKLENAISELPKQSRRAFQLHRFDGKKYAEIAEELKISSSAVERLISRALKKIKDAVASEFGIPLLLLLFLF